MSAGADGHLDEPLVAAERDRLREELGWYRELEAAFPWVRHLGVDDACQFLAEVRAWKATAEYAALAAGQSREEGAENGRIARRRRS